MKIKSLFIAALAAVTMVSCAKDEKGPEKVVEGAKTNMDLTFYVPTSVTRADIDGTADESKLVNITVFIFNKDGSAATGNNSSRAIADFINNGDGSYTLDPDKAIETTAGAKRIYVGANLPDGMDSFANESELAEATAITLADMTHKTLGFSMLSDKVIEKTLITQTAGSKPIANQVETKLERMVAKLFVQNTAADYVSTFNAGDADEFTLTYTFTEYGVGQVAEWMFPDKQWNGSKLLTPSKALGAHPVKGTIFTKPIAADGVDVTAPADVAAVTASSSYVAEVAAANKLMGEATYAMLRSRVELSHFTEVDGNDDLVLVANANPGTYETFWLITGGDKKIYFADDANHDEVAQKVIEITGEASELMYDGGYTFFIAWLNRGLTGLDQLVVKRNQFSHLSITGVADDKFIAMPGTDPDGAGSPDPTDPKFPLPIDPDENIEETEAMLEVKVKVAPWTYVTDNQEIK